MTNEKIAITAYVDDSSNNKFATEANIMTYSGRELDERFTFILYCHPDAINKIVPRANVVTIPIEFPDLDFLRDYVFSRSFIFLRDPQLLQYDYIIKTDTDVFFHSNLNSFIFDNKIYGGPGHYVHNDKMREDLREYAIANGYPDYVHRYMIGPTIFGPAQDVVKVFDQAYHLNEKLFYSMPDGVWGESIYRLVSALYATEIVLSGYEVEILNLIDVSSASSHPVGDTLHMHSYHTDDPYSKFAQQAGKYSKVQKFDGDSLSAYCMNTFIDVRDRGELVYSGS